MFDSQVKSKRPVVEAVKHVAKKLGNMRTNCRKYYIHPAVSEGYLGGSLPKGLQDQEGTVLVAHPPDLTAKEVAMTVFLRRRLGETIAQGQS